MGDDREEVDACEQAKAKVEERLYRVTVIERILASKGNVPGDKSFLVLERQPIVILQKCVRKRGQCWSLNFCPLDIICARQRLQLR